MTKEGRLTKRQKEILEYIKKYSAQKKYPPSIREISANFNLSSPATAHVHVKKLIEKGYLKRGKTSNHLLELQVPNEFETKRNEFLKHIYGDYIKLSTKEQKGNTQYIIDLDHSYEEYLKLRGDIHE